MAANIQTNATSITERDFFQMLLETSPLRHSDTLANAAKRASSQRLTCEKAAYWLSCTHIWATIDINTDLSIGHDGENDPISQRNV